MPRPGRARRAVAMTTAVVALSGSALAAAAPASASGSAAVLSTGAIVRGDGLVEADITPVAPPEVSITSTDLAVAATAPAEDTTAAVPEAPSTTTDEPQLEGVTSRVTSLPARADVVAVTWPGDVAPDLVELRTLQDDGRWDGWTPLDAVAGEDGSVTGTGTVWVGDARRVEVRASRDGADVSADMTLVEIDPGHSPTDDQAPAARASAGQVSTRSASASLASRGAGAGAGRVVPALLSAPVQAGAVLTATATPTAPVVITRAQWGADERKRRGEPSYSATVKAATVHHTADRNTYGPSDSAAIVRADYAYHTQVQGWADIGYNVLVDQYGQIFEGRAGGLSLPVVGAHAGGFNDSTFGVAMMGDYSDVRPSAVMLESVARIIAWKLGGSYWGDPHGVVDLVSAGGGTARWPAGTRVQVHRVFAHRDVGRTACPGDAGYSQMGWIRDRVAQLSGDLRTPIWQHWVRASGGLGGPWGPVTQVEGPAPDGGRATYFSGAGGVTVSSHPVHGTQDVRGALRDGWMAAGGFSGAGYPLRASFPTGVRGGLAQEFSRGVSVVWSTGTGAHAVSGRIRDAWWRSGGINGYGYPTRSVAPVGDGRGSFAEFEADASILTTPQTGTAVVAGSDRQAWWRTGGVGPAGLGYPTRSTGPVGDGRGTFTEFEKDGSVLASASTGARSISGQVRRKWWALGGTRGLGYPTTDTAFVGDGRGVFSEFESGTSILWSSATGARVVFGPLRDAWWRSGGATGPLGYPTTDGINYPTGGGYNDFEGGKVVWSASTGAHAMTGPVLDRWKAMGGERSSLGLPTGDAVATPTGQRQAFERGELVLEGSTVRVVGR